MEIISSSKFKKNNKHFLMKEEQIKLALSKLFYNQKIKWQHLENNKNATLITINKVVLTKDYSNAKIFINLRSLVDEENYNIIAIIRELNKELPLIKKSLGQELNLRRIPNLVFKADTASNKVQKVEELLDSLKFSN